MNEKSNIEDHVKRLNDEQRHRIPGSMVPIILVVFMCLLFILGILGNCAISLVLFHRGKARQITFISNLFEVLTVIQANADITCIVLYTIQLVSRQGFDIDLDAGYWAFCKFAMGTISLSYGISSEVLVLVSTARYLAVYSPLSYHRILTSKVFHAVIAAITVFSMCSFVSFAVIRSTHKKVTNFTHGVVIQYCGAQDRHSFTDFFPFLYFAFLHILVPSIYVIGLVILSGRKRSKLSQGGGSNQHVRSLTLLNNNNIAFINLMQGLPITMILLIDYFVKLPLSIETVRTISDGAMALALFPKALNFFVLYLYSPRFHRNFDKLVGMNLMDALEDCVDTVRSTVGEITDRSKKAQKQVYIVCKQSADFIAAVIMNNEDDFNERHSLYFSQEGDSTSSDE